MDNNIKIAVLLLMMEVLSVSARVPPVSNRIKKRTHTVCVGGKWFKLGSFRFWQRSACIKRRVPSPPLREGDPGGDPGMPGVPQGGGGGKAKTEAQTKSLEPGATTTRPTTINIDLILPSLEAGPNRNASYNPNYGYEPYWVQGDWVFDKDPYEKSSTLYMCGIRCPTVYTEFGKVCGRNKDFVYETFENYCQLRNKDCSNIERWMMLYKGSCYRPLVKYEHRNRGRSAYAAIQSFMTAYPAHLHYVGFCENCPTS